MNGTKVAQHTPGPWRAVVIGGQTEIHAGHSMAVVTTVTERTPVHDANARLIAAAPELLEALKDITAFVAGMSKGYEGPEVEDASAFVVAARAAIAEATGQQ